MPSTLAQYFKTVLDSLPEATTFKGSSDLVVRTGHAVDESNHVLIDFGDDTEQFRTNKRRVVDLQVTLTFKHTSYTTARTLRDALQKYFDEIDVIDATLDMYGRINYIEWDSNDTTDEENGVNMLPSVYTVIATQSLTRSD